MPKYIRFGEERQPARLALNPDAVESVKAVGAGEQASVMICMLSGEQHPQAGTVEDILKHLERTGAAGF
jgi:hypothetical protein